MIIKKSPAEIEAMKEAGRISAKVLREVGARVEPGISTLELDRLAETLIRLEGGRATVGFLGASALRLTTKSSTAFLRRMSF